METPCRAGRVRAAAHALILAVGLAPAHAARADEPAEVEALRREVEALAAENRQMRESLRSLEEAVRSARDEARAAESLARRRAGPPPAGAGDAAPLLAATPRAGGAQLQLLDVSLDVLTSVGGSTAEDEQLELLQGGEHDPRQRGFTLQQAELSLLGAVDPYLTGEAHLIYFLDTEGESRFEIEEAFATSTQLPWGLHEHGLQVEAGHFFTEFGLLNPVHPHEWDWQDQPFVLTRFFGGDGLRAPGVRVGWLTPLPWYSEVHLGVQNAKGETMLSFLASDEVFEERPVGGRPFAGPDVSGAGDLLYLARWVNGWDLSDSTSAQLGASGVLGPNATGSDGRTLIAGADLKVKWRPLVTDRGWPFVTFQAEVLYRDYRADDFLGCAGPEGECERLALGGDTLRDWGMYAQLLWGFRRNWATGLRYEYGTGSGASVGEYAGRSEDPFRADRHRVSPLLVFHPSEFSRLRLQYSYDQYPDGLDGLGDDAHSVWAGLEFLFGAHPAHRY